jgi:RimJ/RimL family protein N-acetyltransferase
VTLLEERSAEVLPQASVPVLETARLILRPPSVEDAKTIALLANDLRIAQNTTLPHPYASGNAEAWLVAVNKKEGEATFVVTLADGTLIGACGVEHRDRPTLELGYWFGAPFWGKGYATEAARAIIDHAFADLGHNALLAGARISNPASRRVLEKCGFQWTGVGLYRIRALASSAPFDRFRLDRGIWASLKTWGKAKRSA